jgi:mRNA interferase MazF
MSVLRGDVVLAWFPFASGAGGKRRPCVVIQNDEDNRKLANTVIVQITTNLARTGDKSHFPIDAATSDGRLTGVLHDSLVSCNNLATIEQSLIAQVIGTLSPALIQELNACLKESLGIQ